MVKHILPSLLFVGLILTTIYLYASEGNYDDVRTREPVDLRTRILLEGDEVLKYILESGSVEMLMDYYDTHLKQDANVSKEVLEILKSECKMNTVIPGNRRRKISNARRLILAKCRGNELKVNNLQFSPSSSGKNVKIKEEMNQVIEPSEESDNEYGYDSDTEPQPEIKIDIAN